MQGQTTHPDGKAHGWATSRPPTEEARIRIDDVVIRSRPRADAESIGRAWDPAIYGFTAPPRILDETPETPPGTLGLRADVGSERLDYFVDPRRDFLCVKYVEWCCINGNWIAGHETILTDLRRLSDGRWTATRTRIDRAECSECCPPRREHIWQLEVRELRDPCLSSEDARAMK